MAILTVVLRVVSGLLGLALGLIGLMALVFLVLVFVPDPALAGQPLGQVWFQHDPFLPLLKTPSIQLMQVFFERKLNLPSLWNPTITTMLNWQSWQALLLLGVAGLLTGPLFWRLATMRRR